MNRYLIAEVGVNFFDIAKKDNISLMEAAKLMCLKAKEGRADAVKFQSYKASTLASVNSPAYWDTSKEKTKTQFELFSKHDSFNEEDFRELSDYCKEINIDFLSTPFDLNSIEYLDKLQKYYKISSSDLTNEPTLRAVAKKNKTILLSTGASTIDEIRWAYNILRSETNADIVLLHCVLSYPTSNEDANLNMIECLKNEFPDAKIGYSDHTIPDKNMVLCCSAYLKGAKVIEKHFTLDKTLPGNDHYHAMDLNDLIKLSDNLDLIDITSGNYTKKPLECEKIPRKEARRSIIVLGNIKKGDILSYDNLTFKRPGYGISPSEISSVIGKIAKRDLEDDALLTKEDFE